MAKKNSIDVYPGDSIQNAIDTALPGATINVNAGTYSQGPITVNQAVTLLGNNAVIDYTKAATSDLDGALNVRADNVRISGFTINSAYGTGVGGIVSGIEVGWFTGPFTTGCQIDNNVINSPDWGLAGYGQTGVMIKNNVISAQDPIWFTNSVDITIKNNVITAETFPASPAIGSGLANAMAAIKLAGNTVGALVKDNQINSENYGILANTAPAQVGFPTNIEINGNQILTSFNGIYSDLGSNFVVKNNVVNAQNYGIWLVNMQGTQAQLGGNSVTSVLTMTKYNVIDVYPGGSIQNAIDTALPGATINVNAGTYSQGPITVNQAVTLLGNNAVIDYTKAATSDLDGALNVRADNVRISGFTINSAYGTGVGGIVSGIEVGWFTGPFTTGCQIDNNVINSPDLV